MAYMQPNYKNITRLSDTIGIPVSENNEPVVELSKELFKIGYKKQDMVPFFGERIFVRKTVAEMLISVQKDLSEEAPNLQLYIFYGYRTPAIQQKYFDSSLKIAKTENIGLSDGEYLEIAHSMSAHIKSAGHTVGGAVDLTIWDRTANKELDMGSDPIKFGDAAYTNYPGLTEEQKNNRNFLSRLMIKQGFAPFLGEWWHFSYGDKEWAFFCKKPNAIYDVVDPNSVI